MIECCGRIDHNDQHLLEVRDLHVHYGEVCALEDIQFEIECGSALALIGANGSGKSTLLKAIVGLVTPRKGDVLWRGQPVEKSNYEIAYLPQRESLDWEFPITVRGLVESGRYARLGPWKAFGAADDEAVEQAIHAMRLQDLAQRHIGALSGGQQQRAFIARALAQEPHVLLLDEPFTGLDKPSREMLVDLLHQLVRHGRLIIASHHDIHDAGEIFDKVLLLKRQQVAFGAAQEILTRDRITETFA